VHFNGHTATTAAPDAAAPHLLLPTIAEACCVATSLMCVLRTYMPGLGFCSGFTSTSNSVDTPGPGSAGKVWGKCVRWGGAVIIGVPAGVEGCRCICGCAAAAAAATGAGGGGGLSAASAASAALRLSSIFLASSSRLFSCASCACGKEGQ
jgi:hypothetical protein